MAASTCKIKGDGAASTGDLSTGEAGATAATLRGDSAATSPSLGNAGVGRGGIGALAVEIVFVLVITEGGLAVSTAVTDDVAGGVAAGARLETASAGAGFAAGGAAAPSALATG